MTKQLKLYRIVKTKWRDKALDGEGAKRYGGRWNSKGRACIYCASTEALAQLEMLVHIQKSDLLSSYTLFELTIKTDQVMQLEALPDNWQAEPAPVETAYIGDQWLEQTPSVALRVPSTIVTREYNYLLNPEHPEFDKIKKTAVALPVTFDPRLK